MEQRISLITLGVADLQRAVAFYERVVGWKAESSPPGVVFFDLNGVVFALWPHNELAKDMGMTGDNVPAYRGYSLAQNVRSEQEVDAIFARLKNNGATILKQPQKPFWGGYSGYFSDPDGHTWEIAYNSFWTIRKDGRVSMKGLMYSHTYVLISEHQSIRQSFIGVQPLLNKSTLMECLAA